MSVTYSCNNETFTGQTIKLTYLNDRFCQIDHIFRDVTTKVWHLQVELTKNDQERTEPIASGNIIGALP